MSYVKGWQNRIENYGSFYHITAAGTVTTAVQGEQNLSPIALYNVSVANTSVASGAHIQVVDASTTGDTVTPTANLAREIYVVSGVNTISQNINHGIFLTKGCVLNITATGNIDLVLHQFNAAS